MTPDQRARALRLADGLSSPMGEPGVTGWATMMDAANLLRELAAEPVRQWLGPYTDAWTALNELRRAVAEVIGADPDVWPTHGNAPLAIAASVATRQMELKKRDAASAEPSPWPEGLRDRIESAIERINNRHAPRRIPADPTDVDLVLAEVRALMDGKDPPFWLKRAIPQDQQDRVPLTDELAVSPQEVTEALRFVRTHLYAAQAQASPGDDSIIMRHVYDAYRRIADLTKEVELHGITGDAK